MTRATLHAIDSYVYEGFKGCTDRNPDYCACSTDVDPECAVCGQEVEPGQNITTVTMIGNPHLPTEHRDQWWDYITAHTSCSALKGD